MVDIITLTGPVAINIYVIEIVNLKSLVKLARHKDFYISEHTEDDQGWNPVEGKLFLRFNCKNVSNLLRKI